MGFWRELLLVLEWQMPMPVAYGWYHLLWIGIIIAFTVFTVAKFKDCSDRTLRRISLVIFIVLIIADLYRQIVYDFVDYDAELGQFVWDYGWYAFPFQLCSSPHYILPFIIWLREGKARDAFISFMCFFSLVGGICVYIYPETCFTESVGVNIQTMLHHGMQITLGIFYAVHERRKYGIRFFLSSLPIMLLMVSIAMVLNVVVHNAFTLLDMNEEFNMFFISPYYDSTLPLVSLIRPLVPYPLFVGLYIAGLTLCALALYGIMYGFLAPSKRRDEKNQRSTSLFVP